jgi:putative ABC transport system permease protein
MGLLEAAAYAASCVLGSKTRSLLTVIGVVIGISSVVLVSAIGTGFKKSIAEQLDMLGAASMQATPDYSKLNASDGLDMEDWEAVLTHKDAKAASPIYETQGKAAKAASDEQTVLVMGVSGGYKDIQSIDLTFGSFVTDSDNRSGRRNAVIDEALAIKLFGKANVVGESFQLRLRTASFNAFVTGVYKSASYAKELYGDTTVAYMPASALMALEGARNPDSLLVSATDRSLVNSLSKDLAKILSIRHKKSEAFIVSTLLDQAEAADGIAGSASAFASLIAAISLVVGGVGVMNIMLATVSERTREIGIRKSLGATEGSIQLQFLVEAVILTLAGGAIGIALGLAGGSALGSAIGIPASAGAPSIGVAVLVSCATGAAFGVYPARKAAKMDPAVALRS